MFKSPPFNYSSAPKVRELQWESSKQTRSSRVHSLTWLNCTGIGSGGGGFWEGATVHIQQSHSARESLRVGVHFVYKCGLFGRLSTELSGLFVVLGGAVMSAAALLLGIALLPRQNS